MEEIFFDNAATTVTSPAAAEAVMKMMTELYGNPSSLHAKGLEAERVVRAARETIAKILKVSPGEIYFTSGGTEADNWAVLGTAHANARAGQTILTTGMEHPAVAEPMKLLSQEGFDVRTIPVDRCGAVDLGFLEENLTDDVILVSVMHVNNEIGSVSPVDAIGALIRKKAPKAVYHTDAVQSFGKLEIFPKRSGIGLMSVSGHKIHGPKGTGFLYIDSKVKIRPLIAGGGQQGGYRSGTENVPGIAGLAVACREAYTDLEEKTGRMRAIRKVLADGSAELGAVIHGMPDGEGAPHILNMSFPGIGAEVLLHALEDKGIYVSSGSACSSHKRAASPTLTATGTPPEEITSSIRISLSDLNTMDEAERALAALREIVPVLGRYRRK